MMISQAVLMKTLMKTCPSPSALPSTTLMVKGSVTWSLTVHLILYTQYIFLYTPVSSLPSLLPLSSSTHLSFCLHLLLLSDDPISCAKEDRLSPSNSVVHLILGLPLLLLSSRSISNIFLSIYRSSLLWTCSNYLN